MKYAYRALVLPPQSRPAYEGSAFSIALVDYSWSSEVNQLSVSTGSNFAERALPSLIGQRRAVAVWLGGLCDVQVLSEIDIRGRRLGSAKDANEFFSCGAR